MYLLEIALAVMLSPFPPSPYQLPPTLGPNIPRVLFHRPRPLGGDFPPNHGRAAATPTICAPQHRIWWSSCSTLPAPSSAENSHPASHPHITFARNDTSLPYPPRPHLCTLVTRVHTRTHGLSTTTLSPCVPTSTAVEMLGTATAVEILGTANTRPSHT